MRKVDITKGDKEKIAKAAGVTPQTVSRYLSGKFKSSVVGIYVDAYIEAQERVARERIATLLKKENWQKSRTKKEKQSIN